MDKIVNLGSGYLTIVAGIAAVVYGLYANDNRLVIEGLAILGIRRAIANK